MPGRMESVENLSRQQYRVRGAVDGFPPFPPPLGNRYAIPTVPQPRRRRYLSYEQETQGDTSIELPRGTFLLGVDSLDALNCCSPIKMSPFAPNRNVPSGSGWWSAPSPCKLMMATPRDPSRVREAKPYGPALDCSLAVAKTALCSTRRRGSRAYGKRGHLYWATEGDISIGLRHLDALNWTLCSMSRRLVPSCISWAQLSANSGVGHPALPLSLRSS